MKKLYEWIDKIWQSIAETIFVRFDFDLPVDELRPINEKKRLIFTTTQGGFIEWLILSSWSRKQGFGAVLMVNRRRVLLFSKPICFLKLLVRKTSYAKLMASDETGPRMIFCPHSERKKLFDPTPAERVLSNLYSELSDDGTLADAQIVPVLFTWRKHTRGARSLTEYLLGLSSKPNLLGKFWYLFRKREDSTIKSLEMFPMEQSDEQKDQLGEDEALKRAKSIRRKTFVLTQQEIRITLGPRKISTHLVKENILRDSEMVEFIDKLSTDDGIPRRKKMAEAYKYIGEIAANYSYRTIEVIYFILTWVFTKVIDGVNTRDEEMEMVRETMKTKPVVFVSAHRSHLDYMVVPYMMFEKGLALPHIAAGINMGFWPFGNLMRRAGGFFIRRSFRGNKLYAFCLRKYMEYLLRNRQNIAFFIEGTRSRSGKMLPPAYGLLKGLLERYDKGILDDIAFIPISICYDKIPEEGAYSKELAGAKKVKESASALIKSRGILNKKFGTIYIRFAQPLSAKEIKTVSQKNHWDETRRVQKVAFQISKIICDVSPVTPKAVVSSILLAHPMAAFSLDELIYIGTSMAKYAKQMNYSLTIPLDQGWVRALEQTVSQMHKTGFIKMNSEEIPALYSCDEKKRLALNFYKNNAIHCYVIPSIVLLALFNVLRQFGNKRVTSFIDLVRTECLRLRNILKFEFFFNPTTEFLSEIDRTATYFLKTAEWREKSASEILLSIKESMGGWNSVSLYLRILGELVESYATAVEFLRESNESSIEKKALVGSIIKFGKQKLQRSEIMFPESISQQNYSNLLLFLENQNLIKLERRPEGVIAQILPWNETMESLILDLSAYVHLMEWNLENLSREIIEASEQNLT